MKTEPLLPKIHWPHQLRQLSIEQLNQLASEIRQYLAEIVSRHGGHLASNLGVVELTMALHYVFDFSTDRLVWDVGHQCYVHKLLTGRRHLLERLRCAGGACGFPDPSESPYDLFAVGHAGTAIATALGLAMGDKFKNRNNRIVALVGDASVVNGVAFEGLNNLQLLRRQLLIVLNDNSMAIDVTQGALAKALAKVRLSHTYEDMDKIARRMVRSLPYIGRHLDQTLDRIKLGIKSTLAPHQIFEQLGVPYFGPVDGHNIKNLIDIFNVVKDVDRPVILHVITEKGRGFKPASADPTRFHSPRPFVVQGAKVIIEPTGRSFTAAFADALIELAREDDRIVALTAAMPDGTGLSKFRKVFPHRCFDMGIAESCTVDTAAGLAKAGMRPVVAIYSTFLQRAFDQIFQEVVLQNLPVVFCIDRAGLVGSDGAVHHGFLDIAYLRSFPNMTLIAPADEPELKQALRFALNWAGPVAIRYPRDRVPAELPGEAAPFERGRARVLREGRDATICAYGVMAGPALEAAGQLAAEGIDVGVINARFAKPLDEQLLTSILSRSSHPLVTVEDHCVVGGFGSAVLELAHRCGLDGAHLHLLGLPEAFIKHDTRAHQLAKAGLDAGSLAVTVRRLLQPGGADRRAGQHDDIPGHLPRRRDWSVSKR